MYRVEDKFLLDYNGMFLCEKKISVFLQNDYFSDKEGYLVSSLYFDSIDNNCYEDTVAGIQDRNKYRIRIYNNSFDIIKLEVKIKKYNRVYKLTSVINRNEMLDLISGKKIRSDNSLSDARTLFNIAIETQLLRPVIMVEYKRKAYVSEMGNVRITLDREIRSSKDIDLFGLDGANYKYLSGDGVLELKYDEYIPAYLCQLLEQNNMIQHSNSKYTRCMEMWR